MPGDKTDYIGYKQTAFQVTIKAKFFPAILKSENSLSGKLSAINFFKNTDGLKTERTCVFLL